MLVGAVLAPTDPVFASAIVGRKDVPARLRRLLSVESGLNDGIALPVVLMLISAAGTTQEHSDLGLVALELVGGLALGVLLPLAVHQLLRIPGLGAEPRLQPLRPVAIAIMLYGIAHLSGANPYLAAFAGGFMTARLSPKAQEAFEQLGEMLAELAKFAALLVFGALLRPQLFVSIGFGGWMVAILTLVLVRPASLAASLVGADLTRRELFAAAWFGPKGFASVVYGLLVLHSGIPNAVEVYELVVVCIALSIVALEYRRTRWHGSLTSKTSPACPIATVEPASPRNPRACSVIQASPQLVIPAECQDLPIFAIRAKCRDLPTFVIPAKAGISMPPNPLSRRKPGSPKSWKAELSTADIHLEKPCG